MSDKRLICCIILLKYTDNRMSFRIQAVGSVQWFCTVFPKKLVLDDYRIFRLVGLIWSWKSRIINIFQIAIIVGHIFVLQVSF